MVLVAILFNQPEWVEEFRPDEKPTIAVLWDESDSMRTQDAVPSTQAAPSTPAAEESSSERSHPDALSDRVAGRSRAPTRLSH